MPPHLLAYRHEDDAVRHGTAQPGRDTHPEPGRDERQLGVVCSPARCPMRGSMPCERSVNISQSWQNSPSGQDTHSSSAKSTRSTVSLPASG